MNVHIWRLDAIQKLSAAGIDTASLDSLVLLYDEVGRDKAWVLAHPEYELQGSAIKKLDTKVAQRKQHVPLAYIRGHAEFYGRDFLVNQHVLVPRPDSEAIIELLKKTYDESDSEILIVDVGTGSGALAITAKLEFPATQVIATDIDKNCLKVAEQNAVRLGAEIDFWQGDLLEAFRLNPSKLFRSFVVIANLPYVPTNYPINEAAQHEPKLALYGGDDGLSLYRRFFANISKLRPTPHFVLTESLQIQHDSMKEIAQKAGYKLISTDGLAQMFSAIKKHS